ncbi:MAG: hypothetical protein ACT4P4_23570 [Betaproteobacteria bacterium]
MSKNLIATPMDRQLLSHGRGRSGVLGALAYNASMRVSPKRLDVIYEGRFGSPSLDFALSPGLVLKSLVKTVGARWSIASQDISVQPGYRVSDVRIKATLFNGRATLEVDADKIGAHFQDARPNADDRTTIRDCLHIALEGITSVLRADPITASSIRHAIYAELLEDPKNNLEFLESCMLHANKMAASALVEGQSTFGGGVKFDINNAPENWLFAFEMNRAFRSDQEIFVNGSLSCFQGTKFSSLDDRIAHLERMLSLATKQLGVEMDYAYATAV